MSAKSAAVHGAFRGESVVRNSRTRCAAQQHPTGINQPLVTIAQPLPLPPHSTPPEFAPPRAAYVHVPFCAHRCGYCNFTLVAGRDDLIDAYLSALELELRQLESPKPVETLFLGGGTPTHLSPVQLDRLLQLVGRWFPLELGGEYSVEANPADISAERVGVLAAHGVNRVSMGAQSFDAAKLQLLERDHTADIIQRACELLRPHVASLALDLIFATPGETLDRWENDLTAALQLQPDHVSTYGLTFELGTRFFARRLHGQLPTGDDETWREMYLTAIDTLSSAGLEHYEVSNFARPGQRCRHNETYWAALPYFAAGPGAARYVAGRREVNHRSTTTYIRRLQGGQSPVAESESLEHEDRAREALVLGLRMLRGVDLLQFSVRWGVAAEALGGEALRRYVAQGLLHIAAGRLQLTQAGLLVSDALWPGLVRV